MFGFGKQSKDNGHLLDYAYETKKEEVFVYKIKEIDGEIFRIFINHYYMGILGEERTIEKLRGKGHISMEEVYSKYQVLDIPLLEIEKGFMKTLFRKDL